VSKITALFLNHQHIV